MATKRPYQLPAVTSFRSDDKIIVDSQTNGTGAMSKDDLLKETAENALAGNVAPAFDPAKANGYDGYAYHIGEIVEYGGDIYVFVTNKSTGSWDADCVEYISVSELLKKKSDLSQAQIYYRLQYISGGESYPYGYLDASGVWVGNYNFDSFRIYLVDDFVYRVKQQYRSGGNKNNIRVFEDTNGTFTQILATNENEFIYKQPAGKNYFIQVVKDLREAGEPYIDVIENSNDVLSFAQQDRTYDFTTDLFEITSIGKFLDKNGDFIINADYDSCLIKVVNGTKYEVDVKLTTPPNINLRLFKKVGTRYEQVYRNRVYVNGPVYVYVPNDGNDYYLQVPKYHTDSDTSSIFKSIQCETFFSKGTTDGENLWTITREGGFLDASGVIVSNVNYDSCLIKAVNGAKYKVINQITPGGNRIRLFEKSGGTYTQILVVQTNSEYSFAIPSTGDIYFQVIKDNRFSGYAQIYRVGFVSEVLDIESLKKASKKVIKILAIGNSYARDDFSYVPRMLENICGCDVVFGILYKGSCTLSQHYDIFNAQGTYEAYDKYETSSGVWVTTTTYNCITALNEEKWDIITLQQQSNASRDYATYQPYLDNLINILCQSADNTFKLGWHLTMAYPTGYSFLAPDTSDEMFEKIVTATESAVADTPLSFVIPCGTAVQNARHTTLDSLGDFGHLSYEGLHLQEGIPCLVAAYSATLKFIELIGEDFKGILANKIRPTQDWITFLNVPQQNGSSVGVTDANCILAQKCAVASIKKPYEITENIT